MEIVAYRCVLDGEPGWMQYHDKTDPLPESWDDDEHPDEVAALVMKVDADIEIERLRKVLADIKAWDVSQYMTLPHELRARVQAELVPNAPPP